MRGEEEDGCGGGRDGGRGAEGDNEVEIPNEVTGGRGARNCRRARGGKADAVDEDDVDPSPLLSRHRHRCATTFSAHRCAAIAAPPRRRQETTTMETTMATTINDDSDDEGDADGDGDDGNGHNGNDDEATTTRPWRRDHDIKIQQSTKWGAVGGRAMMTTATTATATAMATATRRRHSLQRQRRRQQQPSLACRRRCRRNPAPSSLPRCNDDGGGRTARW